MNVSGLVADFDGGGPLAGATVDVFGTPLEADEPCASATSGADGAYAITIPAGCLSAARASWRVSAPDQLDTLQLLVPLDCE